MAEKTDGALGQGIFERILDLLYKGESLSYDQISEKFKIDSATIKRTMIRNKDYFQETSKDGRTKFFKLSEFGNKFVNEKIDSYNKKRRQLIHNLLDQDLEYNQWEVECRKGGDLFSMLQDKLIGELKFGPEESYEDFLEQQNL